MYKHMLDTRAETTMLWILIAVAVLAIAAGVITFLLGHYLPLD